MPKASRDKGNRYELHVAKVMAGDKLSGMFKSGPDLKWRDRYVECKKRKDAFVKMYRWLDDDADMVVHAADYQDDLVTMRLDTFLDIVDDAAGPKWWYKSLGQGSPHEDT